MTKQEAQAKKEELMKELSALDANINAKWTPKKPTLCWVWDEGGTKRIDIIVSTENHEGGWGRYVSWNDLCWDNTVPLTRDEALELIDEEVIE